jgi:hypothetical protein
MKRFSLATLALLASTGLAAQGVTQGVNSDSTGLQYEETDPIPFPEIVIDSVSDTFAMEPGQVKIVGSGLNAVSNVSVNGVDAFIQRVTDTDILFLAPKGMDPGFASLVLSTRRSDVEARLEYCPTLSAQFPMAMTGTTTSLPDGRDFSFIEKEPLSVKMAVQLNNGAPGYYFIAGSLGTRATPLTMLQAGYGLYLDDPWAVASAGQVSGTEFLRVTVKVPWEIYMAGDTVFLQALSTQTEPDGTLACFTNVASVDLSL